MSVTLLKEILEDYDCLGYIEAGSYGDAYDAVASAIFPKLSKDLSIEQIQNIIWDAFYKEFFIVEIDGATVNLGVKQAYYVMGYPIIFKNLALEIRLQLLGI
jgi:hypothetical protein